MPRIIAPVPSTDAQVTLPAYSEPKQKSVPKPATSRADQFRKLRRDAKRKAIGV